MILGKGRFSIVTQQDNFAIKTIFIDDTKPPHNIKAEISALESLKHPNIIPLLDISYTKSIIDPECKLTFPLYKHTLNDVLFAHSKAKFPPGSGWRNKLDIASVQQITAKLANALAYIHSRGVIHRDIKPENILFSSKDSTDPILIDFGIAWVPLIGEAPKVTDVSSSVYKAPELLLGYDGYTESIDVWSLGCVIAKLVSSDSRDLFGDYHGDIALLGTQMCILGAPPPYSVLASRAANWSPAEDNSSEWKRLRAFESEVRKMLAWENRPTAGQVELMFS